MTTARRPPKKPLPRITRPIAKKDPPDRPMIRKLMTLINAIVEESQGQITKRSIAEAVGTNPSEIYEWLSGNRWAPNGEKAILLVAWGHQNSRGFLKALFS